MATQERVVDGDYFYSNCLLEAIKAKLRSPKKVHLTYLSPFINEVFCPHWMWSNGEYDYDFGVERYLKWYERLWFKGCIRKRALGFNQKWKALREAKKKAKRGRIKEPLFYLFHYNEKTMKRRKREKQAKR